MARSSAAAARQIAFVRHAEAGDRDRFTGPDEIRPLSRRGRRQAEAIGKRFGEDVDALVSSPALRCLETLAPLSSRLRQAMDVVAELAEGSDPMKALDFLLTRSETAPMLVCCSHGDVMTGIAEIVLASDVVRTGEVILDKGATMELHVSAGKVSAVSFVPAPNL